MSYLLLLSHGNVASAERNHPDEFVAALRDLEAERARTGLPFTSDEQRRLAALAVFVAKGLLTHDRAAETLTEVQHA